MGVGSFGGFSGMGGFAATRGGSTSSLYAATKLKGSGSSEKPEDPKKPKGPGFWQRLWNSFLSFFK